MRARIVKEDRFSHFNQFLYNNKKLLPLFATWAKLSRKEAAYYAKYGDTTDNRDFSDFFPDLYWDTSNFGYDIVAQRLLEMWNDGHGKDQERGYIVYNDVESQLVVLTVRINEHRGHVYPMKK